MDRFCARGYGGDSTATCRDFERFLERFLGRCFERFFESTHPEDPKLTN